MAQFKKVRRKTHKRKGKGRVWKVRRVSVRSRSRAKTAKAKT